MSFSNPGAVSNTVEKLHRKIRSLRRQGLPMTSSTYPPSTPQPGTVSTPAYRNRKCQDIATEYAYREGLCGASDPVGYVSVARKRHTCKHRCGSAHTLGEMLFKCSCDELCLIHKDCCKDFINECPEMYSKSQRAKMNVAHLNTDCKRTSFRVFTKGRPLESLWSTHEPSIENGLEKMETNTAELALGSLIWNAQFYQTADLASSIIYLNYNEFSDVALATSRPHFVPKLLKITCFSEKSNTKKKLAITKLLPLCFPEEISHMPSILHRSCQSEGVVSCHCDNGGVLHEFLHNACLGRNISVPDMPWQPLTPKKAYDLKDHPTDSVCMVSAEKLQHSKKRVGFVDQRDGKAIRAMVVPFFPETSYLSSSRGRDGDNFSKAGESRSHSEQELDPFTPQAVKFLVEFSNTREKRFLCPGNVSSLSKCRLLECAREALLSSNSATSARHVDDRSCEVPVRATVSSVYQAGVSVCTCLRVVVALADLRIWTTAVKRLTNSYCWIDLGILPVPNGKLHIFSCTLLKLDESVRKLAELYK
ncbi:hypothetical protein PoB_002643900 [Plakobranchus ocellatus]|uniref:SMB domain-containing protein n=1 Tax=Plakobranchus ocellatus TaxID=259542 RepID=A0AAV4A021_9GAST|nr:hypothetical protein PoB_002643900 [Plakobranchus ocellatus]